MCSALAPRWTANVAKRRAVGGKEIAVKWLVAHELTGHRAAGIKLINPRVAGSSPARPTRLTCSFGGCPCLGSARTSRLPTDCQRLGRRIECCLQRRGRLRGSLLPCVLVDGEACPRTAETMKFSHRTHRFASGSTYRPLAEVGGTQETESRQQGVDDPVPHVQQGEWNSSAPIRRDQQVRAATAPAPWQHGRAYRRLHRGPRPSRG
jgi:hypothetical protein